MKKVFISTWYTLFFIYKTKIWELTKNIDSGLYNSENFQIQGWAMGSIGKTSIST